MVRAAAAAKKKKKKKKNMAVAVECNADYADADSNHTSKELWQLALRSLLRFGDHPHRQQYVR